MKKYLPTFFIILSLSLYGCSKGLPSHGVTMSAAHEKFLKTCREEFKYKVRTKLVGKTMWVYVPIEERIVDVKATDKGPFSSNEAQEKIAVRYLDTQITTDAINIEYDIAMGKGYGKSFGYSSSYTEEYSKVQNNVLMALKDSFFDVGKIAGDVEFMDAQKNESHKKLVDSYVKTDKPPEFFVITIANITKGIEIEIMLNFDDYKGAMSPNPIIPHEEYTKRYLTEIRGNTDIISDLDGKHINYRDITLQEFLGKQITNRVNFKYGRSDFPPSDDTIKELLNITATTVRLYDFNAFSSVNLKDLVTGDIKAVTREELKAYEVEEKSKGKYHVIKFF